LAALLDQAAYYSIFCTISLSIPVSRLIYSLPERKCSHPVEAFLAEAILLPVDLDLMDREAHLGRCPAKMAGVH